MEGSDFIWSAKRQEARNDDLHVVGMPTDEGASAMGMNAARIELDALEAELAYRGPERRNGPGAGLAKLLEIGRAHV